MDTLDHSSSFTCPACGDRSPTTVHLCPVVSVGGAPSIGAWTAADLARVDFDDLEQLTRCATAAERAELWLAARCAVEAAGLPVSDARLVGATMRRMLDARSDVGAAAAVAGPAEVAPCRPAVAPPQPAPAPALPGLAVGAEGAVKRLLAASAARPATIAPRSQA